MANPCNRPARAPARKLYTERDAHGCERERERVHLPPDNRLLGNLIARHLRDTGRMRHGAIKEKHPVLAAAFWKSVHEQPLLLSKAIQTIP
jgi:hypothetical protein